MNDYKIIKFQQIRQQTLETFNNRTILSTSPTFKQLIDDINYKGIYQIINFSIFLLLLLLLLLSLLSPTTATDFHALTNCCCNDVSYNTTYL